MPKNTVMRPRIVDPRQHPVRPLRGTDVVAAILVALYDLFAASRLTVVHDSSVHPWPVVWPILFLVGGLTTAWFAWCARETRCKHLTSALAWSGACNITAYASRAAVLVAATGVTARQQLGVATWMLLAFVTTYMWLGIFKPAVELSKLTYPGE